MMRYHLCRTFAALVMSCLWCSAGASQSPAHAGSVSSPHGTVLVGMPRPLVVRSLPRGLRTPPPGNFPFQTTVSADGKVVIHYYNRPAGFGAQALCLIEGYLQHPIADTLGFTLKATSNIYFYADRADFLAGAQPTDPEITGAYTDTGTSTIYMPLTDLSSYEAFSILPHEMTHVVFHQNEDAGTVESREIRFYPLWLDEGLAEHDVSPTSLYGIYDTQDLQAAVAASGVLNLFQYFVFTYPTDPTVDSLCYAEARSFIGYLITIYGADRFHQFLAALHDGAILQNAELYFGADLQSLQNNWRRSIGTFALPHDTGNPAVVPTAQPYAPGTMGGLATKTQLYDIAGQDQFSGDVLRIAFLLTLIALLAIAVGWFQVLQRQRRVAAVRAAEALLGIGDTVPLSRPTTLPQVNWWEMAAIALVVPVVMGIELIWPKIGAAVEWSQSFHAAEIVALLGTVALIALAVLAGVQRRLTAAYLLGVLIAGIALVSAHVEAGIAGLAQGKAYEAQGAYGLAARVFSDAGVAQSESARVQSEWGQEALTLHAYADAVAHLRAAVSATPANPAYRAMLLNAVTTWGQALSAAQMYDQAVNVYQDQARSATCDATCRMTMQNSAGQTLLTWADVLLLGGKSSDALAKVHMVAATYPKTTAGASAQRVLANQANPLSAALAAGNDGDFAAMNILLQMAAQQQPQTAQAAEASEVPAEVTGQIKGTANPTGDRIFFAAFTSKTAAINYFNASDDESVYKIAATVAGGGNYSVRLVPGYWYLVFWDDSSQKYSLNASTASDRSVFFVQPYLIQNEGIITGY
jgi:tetratricopeptide (TPR) repeat protein